MKKFVALFLSLALLLGMMSFAAAEEDMTLNVMLPDFYSDAGWKTLEDGNPVLQAIYEATGVKLNITWVANSAYTEMTSLTLADSKNMPEVMVIQGPRDAITINSARAGAFWDLTDLIPQYENLAAGSETVYNNISVDGRIYGIYRSRPFARAGIYYRSDIAKEVGIEAEPTNVQEFKDLCFALAGKSDDTYAINMCKYVAGTIGITTVMFGAPYNYGVNEEGKIYPAFEDAHFQEGLDFLRELYEKGGIDPDFMTIESGSWNDAERNENPKAFMRLDCLDNGYRYQEWLETNLTGFSADAPVVAMFNAIPNDEGKIQIWPQNTGASGEIVITKTVQEDKLPAIMKFLDWCNSAEGQTLLNWGKEGETYWMHSDGFRYSYPEDDAENQAKYEENTKVLQHSLNQLGMNVNGDLTPAAKGTLLRDEYNYELLGNSKYVIADPCLTFDSETATLMGSTLSTDVEDAQVQYIAGKIDLAGLQAAYQQWHDMGGDMILAEYQDAYDAAK